MTVIRCVTDLNPREQELLLIGGDIVACEHLIQSNSPENGISMELDTGPWQVLLLRS